jgi:hypothetical protein
VSKQHSPLIVGLVGLILLGSCSPAKPVNLLRQAFDAAERDDAAAFGAVVTPNATFTFMNAEPRPLTPAILRERLAPACRLTNFGDVRADILFASGSCHGKTPYGDNYPIFFQAYLRQGKIVRVDQMVYPL